jgi:hypothetical protein
MGFRAIGPFAFAVSVLLPVSCMNQAATSDGFGNAPESYDEGGSSGDGAQSTTQSQMNTKSQPSTAEGGSGPTGPTEAGGSQVTNRDSSSDQGTGNPQQDASVTTRDASTIDASPADVSVVDSPLPTVADGCMQNLGCMLAPAPTTGDIRQDCVNRINQFRTQCACLPALQRWTAGEMCADQEAQYDSTQPTAHAGFIATETACGQGGGGMWAACCSTSGFPGPTADAQDECPGYPDNNTVIGTCLQQMWNEGPPPNGETVQACEMDSTGCFQMHGHFINMTSSNTKVACGFYTSPSGQVWATQNFAP